MRGRTEAEMVVRERSGFENGTRQWNSRRPPAGRDHVPGSHRPARSETVRRKHQVWFSIVCRSSDGELTGWDACAPSGERSLFHPLLDEWVDGLQYSWPRDADIEPAKGLPRKNHLMFGICEDHR